MGRVAPFPQLAAGIQRGDLYAGGGADLRRIVQCVIDGAQAVAVFTQVGHAAVPSCVRDPDPKVFPERFVGGDRGAGRHLGLRRVTV